MTRYILVVLLNMCLLACSKETEYQVTNIQANNPMQTEKKYYLKDCVVKIDLLWESDDTWDVKYAIMDNIQQQMSVALNDAITGKIPLFFGSYTREASHVAIYFPDRCEDRVSMTNKIIQHYLLPNIEDIPDVSVETDVEPGFDGSLPSCCWLDD